MTESGSIRVIIVDDHTVVRSGLRAVLDVSEGIELVGEAGDGEEAVKICESLQPDVILMDLQMPKMDGVEATRIIHEKWPQIHIIALTSYKEKEYVEGVLKAGATSYLLKNVSAEELVSAAGLDLAELEITLEADLDAAQADAAALRGDLIVMAEELDAATAQVPAVHPMQGDVDELVASFREAIADADADAIAALFTVGASSISPSDLP